MSIDTDTKINTNTHEYADNHCNAAKDTATAISTTAVIEERH